VTAPHDGSILADDPADATADVPLVAAAADGVAIPAYLQSVYRWAYLDPTNVRLLDRDIVATVILFGNYERLLRTCLAEIRPGDRVLQAAHVYGRFIPKLAEHVGPQGRLDVVDVVPLQADRCRRKLHGVSHARVRVADAADPGTERYDVASAFFLLHEIPDEQKRAVVNALLGQLVPGGKAVFVDYHGPALWHPLRRPLRRMFTRLEPFAESLWHHRIEDFATDAGAFRWRTETLFGGVYQKTVAEFR
jgi:SAM-dependent methyltransferase